MDTSNAGPGPTVHIAAVEVYRLRQPLAEPYHVSFSTFDAFDTCLAMLQAEDGRTAWGEATACTGYVPETGDEMWQFLLDQSPRVMGVPPESAIADLLPAAAHRPFAATPLLTALEALSGQAPRIAGRVVVPLVGLLSGENDREMEAAFWTQVGRGHTTLKLKVGFDVDRDVGRAALAQGLARQVHGVWIRIDANQGYSLEAAQRFARSLDPAVVELFEQPFPAGDWESQAALARCAPVPLMLDESIHGAEDVERTASTGCAQYVKFKLMKAGSARRLAKQIALARRLGLRVVLGNGVAGEVGCYQEAAVAAATGLETSGEMNGFSKLRRPLLEAPLPTAPGAMLVWADLQPVPDPERLAELALARRSWTQPTC